MQRRGKSPSVSMRCCRLGCWCGPGRGVKGCQPATPWPGCRSRRRIHCRRRNRSAEHRDLKSEWQSASTGRKNFRDVRRPGSASQIWNASGVQPRVTAEFGKQPFTVPSAPSQTFACQAVRLNVCLQCAQSIRVDRSPAEHSLNLMRKCGNSYFPACETLAQGHFS